VLRGEYQRQLVLAEELSEGSTSTLGEGKFERMSWRHDVNLPSHHDKTSWV
jgi:hypothetical protein